MSTFCVGFPIYRKYDTILHETFGPLKPPANNVLPKK